MSMQIYNFDQEISRRNTNSLKYDFAAERGRPADVLPLWVADMDFPAPRPVLDALHKAVDHGIFGYSEVKEGYYPFPPGSKSISVGKQNRSGSLKRRGWFLLWQRRFVHSRSRETAC